MNEISNSSKYQLEEIHYPCTHNTTDSEGIHHPILQEFPTQHNPRTIRFIVNFHKYFVCTILQRIFKKLNLALSLHIIHYHFPFALWVPYIDNPTTKIIS